MEECKMRNWSRTSSIHLERDRLTDSSILVMFAEKWGEWWRRNQKWREESSPRSSLNLNDRWSNSMPIFAGSVLGSVCAATHMKCDINLWQVVLCDLVNMPQKTREKWEVEWQGQQNTTSINVRRSGGNPSDVWYLCCPYTCLRVPFVSDFFPALSPSVA